MVLQILGCSRPCCPCHRNFLAVVQPRELFVLDPSSKTLLDYFTWIIVFRKSIVNNRLQFLKQTIQPLRRKSGVTLKKEMRLVRPEINFLEFFRLRHAAPPTLRQSGQTCRSFASSTGSYSWL